MSQGWLRKGRTAGRRPETAARETPCAIPALTSWALRRFYHTEGIDPSRSAVRTWRRLASLRAPDRPRRIETKRTSGKSAGPRGSPDGPTTGGRLLASPAENGPTGSPSYYGSTALPIAGAATGPAAAKRTYAGASRSGTPSALAKPGEHRTKATALDRNTDGPLRAYGRFRARRRERMPASGARAAAIGPPYREINAVAAGRGTVPPARQPQADLRRRRSGKLPTGPAPPKRVWAGDLPNLPIAGCGHRSRNHRSGFTLAPVRAAPPSALAQQ